MRQDPAHAMTPTEPFTDHVPRSSTNDQLPSPKAENHGSLHPSAATPDASHGNNEDITNHPHSTIRGSSPTEASKSPVPLPTIDSINLSGRFIDIIVPHNGSPSDNPPAPIKVDLNSCLLISDLFKILHEVFEGRGIDNIVVKFKDSTVYGLMNWDMDNDKSGQILWKLLLDVLVERTHDVCPIEARIEV